MAKESFKEEAKKKKLGKYYYQILNILVTPPVSSTHTQMDDEKYDETKDELEMRDSTNNIGKFLFV